jgi:hypothetical protein
MTYYDTFELDCGCRWSCKCGKNDGGKKLAEVRAENEALRRELAMTPKEKRERRQRAAAMDLEAWVRNVKKDDLPSSWARLYEAAIEFGRSGAEP